MGFGRSLMRSALIMAAVTVATFNLWRFMPPGALPLIAYAWAPLAIGVVLQRFRSYPDEALPFLWLPAIGATAAALVGDAQMARLCFGPSLVALAIIAWSVADNWPMRAFAVGIMTEPVMWFMANLAPKIYGPEVAMSAFGRAFGAWGAPSQWLAIMAIYAVAWYNWRAKDA